ncbi:MAG: glycosyltransferase family 39 protein [Bacteroidia bacterium]
MLKTDKNEFQEPNRNALIWGLSILAINVAIKAIFLGFPQIGHDEPFTLFRVQKPYTELIADLASNNHPPLFESIMWVWLRLVCFNASLLRIIPLVFSSVAAMSIFWLGKKHFSLFIGVVAALLFTFSDYHFYLSHEIRSYPLFALLTVLSFNVYFSLIDAFKNLTSANKLDKQVWKYLASFTILSTLLLYTHYFSATIIAAQLFNTIVVVQNRKLNFHLFKSLLVTFILYLPQIIMVKTRMATKVEGGHWLASPGAEELFNVLRKFFNLPLLAVAGITLSILAFWLARKAPYFKKLLGIGLLFPGVYIGMWLLAQWVPVFQDRYISFTIIGAFLLTAIALDHLPKIIKLSIACLLIISMMFLVKYQPNNHQWVPEIVQIINKEKTENTKVLIYPKWSLQCFSYHYNLAHFNDYQHTKALLAQENIFFGFEQNASNLISQSKENEKFIIINFEGSISELAKDFRHLKPRIIDKERHGVMILKVE